MTTLRHRATLALYGAGGTIVGGTLGALFFVALWGAK